MKLLDKEYLGHEDDKFWNEAWLLIDEERKQLYTEGAPKTILQFWQRCYFEDLWNFIKDKANLFKFLEFGSGRGTISMYLTAQGCDVTMMDKSYNAFILAKNNFKQSHLKLPYFVLSDIKNSGFASNSFDCIYNAGVLEHFKNPKVILAEALRLLKPAGLIFMVVVPEFSIWQSWLAMLILNPVGLCANIFKFLLKKLLGWHSFNRTITCTNYSCLQYKKWLEELGACNIECIPYNHYHKVYKNEKLEKIINVPIYRLCHLITLTIGNYPLLRTHPNISLCQLITCTKKY